MSINTFAEAQSLATVGAVHREVLHSLIVHNVSMFPCSRRLKFCSSSVQSHYISLVELVSVHYMLLWRSTVVTAHQLNTSVWICHVSCLVINRSYLCCCSKKRVASFSFIRRQSQLYLIDLFLYLFLWYCFYIMYILLLCSVYLIKMDQVKLVASVPIWISVKYR